MASVFCDSFDPYNNFLQKWSSGSAGYNTNPAFVRTGAQSLNPSGAGFNNLPRINFANRLTMIAGVAYYAASFGGAGNQIMFFYQQSGPFGGFTAGEVDVIPTGAIAFGWNGATFATSAPGVISTGQFYYVEFQATMQLGGAYQIRVNGQTVLSGVYPSGTYPNGSWTTGADSFMLPGSDVNDVYYDDFYLLDSTGAVNNTFLGPIQVFAILPDANESPLNWTPLSGTNFSEVNQSPPPGDAAYVFDDTNGAIDQYHYTPAGPSAAYTISFVQHSLCCRLDSAGGHTVGSQINSHQLNAVQIGSNSVGATYAYALFPWDVNPNTGVQFVPADFATAFFGPAITS